MKNIIDSLQTQKLVNLRTLLDERRLNDFCLHESIDTKYIMSICCEPYFKPMLDQYLSKVLVNGMVVPMKDLETYQKIKLKVVNLYKVFFFGDPISLYEREIEKKYLAMKQDKWHKFMFKNVRKIEIKYFFVHNQSFQFILANGHIMSRNVWKEYETGEQEIFFCMMIFGHFMMIFQKLSKTIF